MTRPSRMLACDPKAIPAAQRPRYLHLAERLRAAFLDRSELMDGYHFLLDPGQIDLPEVAEWIDMERLCCPFLSFQLEAACEGYRLTMRGPQGVNEILRETFPAV